MKIYNFMNSFLLLTYDILCFYLSRILYLILLHFIFHHLFVIFLFLLCNARIYEYEIYKNITSKKNANGIYIIVIKFIEYINF